MNATAKAIFDALHSGHTVEAAHLAAQLSPRLVFDAIDYGLLEEHGAMYRDLVVAWLPLAEAVERPEIAGWLANMSVADLAYLDIQAQSAKLLASSVRDACARLGSIIEEIAGPLADGPDAGMTKAQAAEFEASAVAIRAMPLPQLG